MSSNDDWTNQVVSRVIIAGTGSGTGVFVYDGPAGLFPPIGWIGEGPDDPYGNALPNDATMGIADTGTFSAGNTVINALGTLSYNGTPAANGLFYSAAPSLFRDPFNNLVMPGIITYLHSAGIYIALQHTGADIIAYTATSQAGPWTQRSDINFSVISGGGVGYVTVNAPIQSASGTPATPTVITTDFWNSAALVNSWAGSGSATNGLWYRLNIDNTVQLVGDLSSPGTASVITTLPAGYRPAQGINIEFSRYDDSGTAHALVAASGTITMQTTVGSGKGLFCNAYIPLDTL